MGVCKLVNRKSRLTLGLDGENITSLSSRTNVVLKHSTNNSQGLWVIDSVSETSDCFIKSFVNQSYGLNVNRITGTLHFNCDVMPLSGNLTDESVRFEPVSGGYFKIKLSNYNAVLTEEGTQADANVKWAIDEGTFDQQWRLVYVSMLEKECVDEECHLISFGGTGASLVVAGYSKPERETPVTVDEQISFRNAQKWIAKVDASSISHTKIWFKNSDGYYLCRDGQTAKAMVSNAATDDESEMTFIKQGIDTYEIVLSSTNGANIRTYYLTAQNGEAVFALYDYSDHLSQIWKCDADIFYNIANGTDTAGYSGGASKLNALVAGKEEFVGRYYSSLEHTEKDLLTHTEVNKIHNAGLKIVSLYEDGGGAGDIIAEKGALNAASAYQSAVSCGQPEGTAIYFAVDYVPDTSQMSNVQAYFQAINNYFEDYSVPYKIGVYGCKKVCWEIKQVLSLAEYSFLICLMIEVQLLMTIFRCTT